MSERVGLPITCGLSLSLYMQATVPEHVTMRGTLCVLGGRGQHQISFPISTLFWRRPLTERSHQI